MKPDESPRIPVTKTILRGTEANVESILPDRNFVENAICNDTDGVIDFSNDGIYAATEIAAYGVRDIRPKNEDGVLVYFSSRAIAGADGMGDPPFGEIASAAALASFHIDTKQGIPINDMASRACVHLKNGFQSWLDQQRSPVVNYPGAAVGYCREVNEVGRKKVEGFIVGDYKAIIIDVTERMIVYESPAQTLGADLEAEGVAAALVPGSRNVLTNSVNASGKLEKPAISFSHEIKEGHTIVTILCSDGVFNEVVSAEMLERVLDLAAQDQITCAGKEILDLAKDRLTRDNVSLVLMISVSN